MEKMEKIVSLAGKRSFRALLLEADPSERMVERYLAEGEMWVWRDGESRVVGEAVVDVAAGEIKNLAVVASCRGSGRGRGMLDDLCAHYRGRFASLKVGTSDGGRGFYERCGFRYSHTVPNFFTDHYPAPVIDEDGSLCRDMIVLERPL